MKKKQQHWKQPLLYNIESLFFFVTLCSYAKRVATVLSLLEFMSILRVSDVNFEGILFYNTRCEHNKSITF